VELKAGRQGLTKKNDNKVIGQHQGYVLK